MIKYLSHSITEHTHIVTQEKIYELSYWYTSDEAPQTAGRRHAGYFNSRQEAENKHNENLVKGLINET